MVWSMQMVTRGWMVHLQVPWRFSSQWLSGQLCSLMGSGLTCHTESSKPKPICKVDWVILCWVGCISTGRQELLMAAGQMCESQSQWGPWVTSGNQGDTGMTRKLWPEQIWLTPCDIFLYIIILNWNCVLSNLLTYINSHHLDIVRSSFAILSKSVIRNYKCSAILRCVLSLPIINL